MSTFRLFLIPATFFLLCTCSSGNFAGGSGQRSSVKKGGGSGDETVPKVDPVPPGPCDSSQQISASNPDKKILLYAPGEYAAGNKFATGLQDGLKKSGFDVQLVNSVDGIGGQDACKLWTSYKQIWLLLPCNNKQTMSEDSFQAIKKFYEFGGGIVLTADAHFFKGGEANTHCKTDWGGSVAQPSDAVKIGNSVLGIDLKESAVVAPGFLANLDGNHPLKSTLAGVKSTWKQRIAGSNNPQLKMSGDNGIIEEEVNGGFTRRAVILPAAYSYHSPGSFDPMIAIANYLEDKTRIVLHTNLGLADEDAGKYLVLPDNPLAKVSSEVLRDRLKSADKHAVSDSIRELSMRGDITPEEMFIFFEHTHMFVKLTTPVAVSVYKNQGRMKNALIDALSENDISNDVLSGLVASAVLLDVRDVAGPLIVQLEKTRDSDVVIEIANALAAFKAVGAKSALQRKLEILDPEKKAKLNELLVGMKP